MTDGQDEFVTIRPRQVALSSQSESASPRPHLSVGMLLVGAGLTLLIAIAVWVFLYLPARTPLAVAQAPTPTTRPATTEPTATPKPTGPAPYEALQIDRERKRAQETLAQFVRLQPRGHVAEHRRIRHGERPRLRERRNVLRAAASRERKPCLLYTSPSPRDA